MSAWNDLVRRTWEHRNGVAEGFTKAYGVHRLVYFEALEDVSLAQRRERSQALAPRLEDRADREGEPGLARSV
jgi:putative endonuclease